MKHVSIDLEVMGNGINGLLLAIGAVEFNINTGEVIGDPFHCNVDIQSSIENDGKFNGSTVKWWLTQSDEARAALFSPEPIHIHHALFQFGCWLRDLEAGEEPNSTIVWGNGIRSDNVWLAGAYERAGLDCPFEFWQDGDVRSLVLLGRAAGINPKNETPFKGSPHNPVDDAIHQARYLSKIWRHFIK